MSSAETTNYLAAIDRFAEHWLPVVFPDEYNMLRGSNQRATLLAAEEASCFRNNALKPQRMAACFSLLFTRFIHTSINDIEGDERPVLTFVTKKGYWLYKVARHCLSYIRDVFPEDTYLNCINFWTDAVEVQSDRYFTKTLKLDAYQDRNIVIVDDIIHTGESIAQFVRNRYLKIVRYVVFAMYKGAEAQIADKISLEKLRTNTSVELDDLGALSVEQVILFQALGVPYVIDLPAVILDTPGVNLPDEDIFFSSGRLPASVFDEICAACGENGWGRADISFSVKPGHESQSCVFCLAQDPIRNKFKNLFQNLVVECSYRQTTEYVDVTFVPFAIMRSVRLDELYTLFRIAFQGTEYGEDMARFVQGWDTKDYCSLLVTALYRALVFYFSMYVMEQFRKFLMRFGVSLQVDKTCISEHWDDSFMRSMETLFPEGEISPTIRAICRQSDIELSEEYWTTKKDPYRIDSSNNLYFIMYKFFMQSRNTRGSDFCSIERLEATMSKQLGKQIDDMSFRSDFTQTVLQLLNQSAIGNAVRLDHRSGYVSRGFRSGENCSLTLPFNHPAVFCAVYEYYSCCETTATEVTGVTFTYLKNYELLKQSVLSYISNARLDTYLDAKEATRLLDHFQNVDPEVNVKNKRYIVDGLLEQPTIEAMLAKELQRLVRRLPLQ